MSALDVFTYSGQDVRTVIIDGEPWFVLVDLCAVLDIANAGNVAARIDIAGIRQTDISSGGQRRSVTIVSEPGMYEVVIRSDKPEAVVFRRWITSEVIPSIRKTGRYAAPAAELTLDLGTIKQLNAAVTVLLEQNERVTARAIVAEQFKDAIVTNDGLTPREFHKHYLSDFTEGEFNELLYKRGLLIDQRGQRSDSRGKPKPGKQHRHPAFSGKRFFYLHTTVKESTGERFENVRVRPGDAEIALAEYCRNSLSKAVAA